jgi:hypothetical protein
MSESLELQKTELQITKTHKSRKFTLVLLSLILIVGGAALAAFYPALQAVYATMVSGILGSLAIYAGSNVAQKLVTKD